MGRADIIEIQRGTKFVRAPDGSSVTDAAFIGEVAGRIVCRMTLSWSWGPPVPADCHSAALAEKRLNEVLADDDGADWMALQQAVMPWVDRILNIPVSATTVVFAGKTLRAASEEDAADLVANHGFTLAAGAGPKSRPTATTSAALPPGPEQGTGQTP